MQQEGKQCPDVCLQQRWGKRWNNISPKLAISSQKMIKTNAYLALFEGLIYPNLSISPLKGQKNNKMMYIFGYILLFRHKMI